MTDMASAQRSLPTWDQVVALRDFIHSRTYAAVAPTIRLNGEPPQAPASDLARVSEVSQALYQVTSHCCAGGLQLDEEGEHLLAERVLDERRLVGPLGAEDVAEPLGLRLAASAGVVVRAGPVPRWCAGENSIPSTPSAIAKGTHFASVKRTAP